MATAVLDLDLDRLPAEIPGLGGYGHALALIRVGGRPVGQALLTVTGGRLDGGPELRHALIEAAGWPFWERWLRDYLGEEARPTFPLPKATVAVCTRDRPEDLRRCLDALVHLPDDGQELLVVDNCPSTDATWRIVEGYENVRYVREDRPGLNIARNRALREARHEVVAFNDDDAVVDPNWLRALVKNFDDPRVLCVTGLTMPLELETEAQGWFDWYFPLGRGFSRVVFECPGDDPLEGWHAGAGANMAVRRDIPEKVGPFDEALDVGTPARAGGDVEIFSRILAAGYRIVYDPAVLKWHRHQPSWRGVRQKFYSYGIGGAAAWTRSLLVDGELGVPWHGAKSLGYLLPSLVRALFRRPDSTPFDLVLAHILGLAVGPWAYLYSRWRLRAAGP